MRPRPEGRGEQDRCHPCDQHGRRFNAATTRRPWRRRPGEDGPRPRHGVQCGHDPKAVENALRTLQMGRLVDASMRPRPEGRGEPARRLPRPLRCSRFNAATTRRPWRKPLRVSHYSNTATLQCGHDPKAVEKPDARADRAARPPLQCGHDPKAVEKAAAIVPLTPRTTALQCGHDPKAVEKVAPPAGVRLRDLASMRPRPEGRGEGARPATQPEPPPLQCGHDPKAVENILRRSAVQFGPPASMRPRPEGRGEVKEAATVAYSGARRFNAATTRRPWRTGFSRIMPARRWASMRPRPEGRGESCRERFRLLAVEASMRPRPEGRGEGGVQVLRRDAGAASMRPRPEGRGERTSPSRST